MNRCYNSIKSCQRKVFIAEAFLMKVAKFGGSSLASSETLKKVREIVMADSERSVIVVSAPGKRFKDDNKVTDLLYICHAHIKYKVKYDDIWNDIAGRYLEMDRECGLSGQISEVLDSVRDSFSKKTSVDEIVSRGEYLNARLIAEYLGYDFVDAAEWLHFRTDGTVDLESTYGSLRELYTVHKKMVLPGFYGSLPDGRIHTFSRGGSDITGSIAAAALGASMYENWTDVNGILMADPKIVDNPRPIKRVTFAELRDLSYMGAEVLHPEAVFPVREAGIPLYIKNTADMNSEGTLIQESFPDETFDANSKFITGITGKKHYSIITVSKNRITEDLSFHRRLLEIVEGYSLLIEHTFQSADCIAFMISSEQLSGCLYNLVSDIQKKCDADSVNVTEGVSLVALVGRKMAAPSGISGRILGALGSHHINVRTIEYGSDEINIIIGVADEHFKEAIRVLYDSFAEV